MKGGDPEPRAKTGGDDTRTPVASQKLAARMLVRELTAKSLTVGGLLLEGIVSERLASIPLWWGCEAAMNALHITVEMRTRSRVSGKCQAIDKANRQREV